MNNAVDRVYRLLSLKENNPWKVPSRDRLRVNIWAAWDDPEPWTNKFVRAQSWHQLSPTLQLSL